MTPAQPPLLEVKNLNVSFSIPGQGFARATTFDAVKDLSFAVDRGQTLAIVGESGSGKSTTARAILALVKARSGQVLFKGRDLLTLTAREMRAQRARIQMIFQDPIASLSPRRTVFQLIEEPLLVHVPKMSGADRAAKVLTYMDRMRLPATARNRYPHEFSGGQAQRIGIARALICEPDLLIADEPVSALDVSIQAEVLDLLAEIKQQQDLALIFISHDLSVVYQVCDQVLVMKQGQVRESGRVEQVFDAPQDPYTQRLLAAIPRLV